MKEFLEAKYLNPLTDFGFKKLFFNELDKELLIDLLNEIICEENKITDLQFQPTLQLGDLEKDRKVIFDIFCTNEKGEYFIVEMQKAKEPYFRDRCLYYSTFPIQKQGLPGSWNYRLKAVYMVAILDFVLFNESEGDKDYFIERVQLLRERTKSLYSKKLNFIFVELPKFNKELQELTTNIDRWMFCLRNLSCLDNYPSEVQGRIFEKLFKTAEIKQLTEKDMEEYRKSILEYQDVRDAVDYAREEARKEGREEGVGVGKKEEKTEITLKCLQEGLPVETISRITGLTEAQIRNISNNK